ncbi:MAG TPA: DUF3429 domain-containing protein [Burkholderiales bacterium]|nr:DUF3429 domain-containing protein [Burkholderiales bacterium]
MLQPDDRTPIPKTPLWLGTGGLVPLVVIASAMWALPEAYTPTLLFYLTSYAAVMVTFVGAVHWGVSLVHPGMAEQDQSVFMTWSVVPALVGWVSLLLPAKTGLLLLIASFVIQYAADRQLAQRFRMPSWYLRLRTGLTSVAVLCLALALIHLARG